MKHTSIHFCIFLSLSLVLSQASAQEALHIIPRPAEATTGGGQFRLKSNTAIIAEGDSALYVANMLSDALNTPTGYRLTARKGSGAATNTILLRIAAGGPEEGYHLKATPSGVVITASKPQGLFYGMQSLLQLFPAPVRAKSVQQGVQWQIPAADIRDYPAFGWRGLMLDVSRHFFTKDNLKQYIDQMSQYKFNVFHLHLADDQGWRVEIKGMPKLTERGAWRVHREGEWWSFLPPQPGEETTYGGFYTQDDIREIVQYARERFITIVPEIDVPGHSLALITAYPELSCTKQQYAVNPGSRFVNECNVVCIANDSTWKALDLIFTQIAELFPGQYIHIGGDEANRTWWGRHADDLALMKKENIKGLPELQSYFTRRLERMIVAKGKKMIGWDEILEGGLAPEATVMSWRGMEGGIKAANMGHPVVMTPAHSAYLDLYQGDPLAEPNTYSMLRLHTCYAFEPVPPGVAHNLILGGQGNLWTEAVPNYRQVEYMTWPRGMALSEVFWSPAAARNWKSFTTRLEAQFPYFDAAGVKYARSAYDPIISAVKVNDRDSLRVKLSAEWPGLDIYYAFDGTDPDAMYPRYEGQPLRIPKGASQIRVVTYRNGRPVGKQINCPVKELANRIEKQ
ncbi:beta-N-acetylhexosaminidase [Chitinophaga lutea]